MNLLGDLFSLKELEVGDGEIRAVLHIDPNHAILRGHFPGLPVMPGVCMMQVLREIFQRANASPVRITRGDNIKFLTVLEPSKYPQVFAVVRHQKAEGGYEVSASLETLPGSEPPFVFLKFKGAYEVIE